MNKKSILKTAVLGALAIQLSSCGEIIDSGHRGVKVNLGKVQQEALTEGLYFYNPLTTSIKEIDGRVKKITLQTKVYTKDVQQAEVVYVLNASLDLNKVTELYTKYGVRNDGVGSEDLKTKIVLPVTSSAVKSIIGTWNATDVISNRQQVTEDILKLVKQKLSDQYIEVSNIEITEINYADKFERAVEDKVVAIQKAEEAKNNTVRIQEEANQKVIDAKAEAESMRIRAKALAQNKSLVEYEAVQKWDGKMPQYMLGESTMPFIGIK